VTEELDATEAHATLARHIANLVADVLRALPQEDRTAAQTELTNQIIRLLAANPIDATRDDDVGRPDRRINRPIREPVCDHEIG
jgi:hypothetical protein